MREILNLSLPLSVWLATFSGIYGLEGLVCSRRWGEFGLDLAAGRAALLAAGLLAVAVQVALLLALRSERFGSPPGFARRLSLGLSAVALVATLWTLIPLVAVSLCL